MDISPPLFLGQEPHPGDATFMALLLFIMYQTTGINANNQSHHICENGKSFRNPRLTQQDGYSILLCKSIKKSQRNH